MDDKWRTVSCPNCRGYGIIDAPMDWYGMRECDDCGESGRIWIRPKGHTFEYPGGPATGMWSEGAYKKGTPQMPYTRHAWTETDAEIDKFILDNSGSLDQDLNTVHCACGFTGTIRQHGEHEEKMRTEFVTIMEGKHSAE